MFKKLYCPTLVGIDDHSNDQNNEPALIPNPSANETLLKYEVTKILSNVRIVLFSSSGQKIEELFTGTKGKGLHEFLINIEFIPLTACTFAMYL